MKAKNLLILSIGVIIVGAFAINRSNSQALLNNASRALPANEVVNARQFDDKSEDAKTKAEEIANAVNKLEQIEKVSVIITGNSAIVGIEIKGELTDEKLIQIKKDAEKAARSAAAEIDHIAVTAGPELLERINKVADYSTGEEIEENNALNKNAEEIINSLTPAM